MKQNRILLCVLSGFLVYLSRQTVGKMALFPILIFEGEFLHILKARLPLSIMPQASPLKQVVSEEKSGPPRFLGLSDAQCQLYQTLFNPPINCKVNFPVTKRALKRGEFLTRRQEKNRKERRVLSRERCTSGRETTYKTIFSCHSFGKRFGQLLFTIDKKRRVIVSKK